MAEGEKMHSKLPDSLFLNRKKTTKKPTIFRKLAVFNRKVDPGGKTKLREHKRFKKQEQKCHEKE